MLNAGNIFSQIQNGVGIVPEAEVWIKFTLMNYSFKIESMTDESQYKLSNTIFADIPLGLECPLILLCYVEEMLRPTQDEQ